MKKLGLISVLGISLGLVGCSFGSDTPDIIGSEFSGGYSAEVILTPRLDCDIEGFTNDKTFPSTSGTAEVSVGVNADDHTKGGLSLMITGRGFGKIDPMDWDVQMDIWDFHRVEGQQYPGYRIEGALLHSDTLFEDTDFNLWDAYRAVSFDKSILRWVNGPNFTFEGSLNLPTVALTTNLSEADSIHVMNTLRDKNNGNTAYVRLHIKAVTTQGAPVK